MNRYARILIAVLALLLVVAGSALATRGGKSAEHRSPMAASHQPEASDAERTDTDTESAEGAPSDKLLGRLVDRLADAGIDSDAETLAALAADYGVGGAVRLVTWADASGMDVSELAAMFDSGLGWGAIAHQLMEDDPSLDLSPGIGWVIGKGHANGHGQATAEAHRP
jgi:hypothetical protein